MSYHEPVLLAESLEALAIKPAGNYVDATFGGGGHALRLLDRLDGNGRLYAFDQDEDARANALQAPFAGNPKFHFIASNFRDVKRQLRSEGVRAGTVHGVLADLGVSSYQLDTPERGFSYRFDAELDMRMNRIEGPSAADLLNSRAADELQRIFGELGEVRNARTLAQAIARLRTQKPFRTTADLVAACEPLVMGERWRYLSQVFQALRMEVNDELGALREFLRGALDMLAAEGRLVVITYHSIEDRLVKNFMKTGDPDGAVDKDFYGNITRPFELIYRKPLEPSDEEIKRNPRARSAKLRVAAKKNG
jgi:16S rRNA (cytosine1402-N4)-methyltransferase